MRPRSTAARRHAPPVTAWGSGMNLELFADEKRWVAWQEEIRNDETTKVPKNPSSGGNARVPTDPMTYGTRAKAKWRWEKLKKKATKGGIGIVLGELPNGQHLAGIDLDSCLGARLDEWAEEVVERFDTYSEISPSGNGVKLFFLMTAADMDKLHGLLGRDFNGKQLTRKAFTAGKHREVAIDTARFYAVTDQHIQWPPQVGMPSMITRQMKADLASRGFTTDQIREMTPGQAHEHLNTPMIRLVPFADVEWFVNEVGPRYLAEAQARAQPSYKDYRRARFKESGRTKHKGNGHDNNFEALAQTQIDLGVELGGHDLDLSGSGYGYRFMQNCHGIGMSEEQAHAAILADKTDAGEWARRSDKRQLDRAWKNSKPEQQKFEEEPVDLWNHFEPPALPHNLLPKVIEDYATVQGETMGADPVGLAMAALAICAGATPDGIKLQMKQHSEEWKESARIWVGLVGLPSTKKTPIINMTVKPLAKIDTELLRQYLYEMNTYKNLTPEERKGAQQPVQRRLRLEDTTIESAQEVLAGSPNGVLLHQDELSGWFGSMDKYSGGRGAAKDRGFWLQSYNGLPYAWSRIGRGQGIIPNLSVTLIGGIQPDIIRKLSANSYDDGFLQRMLLIILRPAVMGKDEPTPAVADKYAKLIERLTELSPPCESFSHQPIELRFDAEVQPLREELERKHLAMMQLESVNKKLASHIGKYDGLFGRLCVLWHCIEHAHEKALPPVVTKTTAKRVAEFMHRFLLPHAFAFYSGVLGLADDHDRIAAVAGYILAHKLERMTNRDIARGDGTMRRLTERDTEQVFEQLEALGWVNRAPGGRTSRAGTLHWLVNPLVHTRFGDRAAKEIARRTAAREMILNTVQKQGTSK